MDQDQQNQPTPLRPIQPDQAAPAAQPEPAVPQPAPAPTQVADPVMAQPDQAAPAANPMQMPPTPAAPASGGSRKLIGVVMIVVALAILVGLVLVIF